MDDDADAYLRLASKLKWKHFPSGHSSLSQRKGGRGGISKAAAEVKETSLKENLTNGTVVIGMKGRLPMKKKRRRTDDSDSDDEKGTTPLIDESTIPNSSCFVSTTTDTNNNNNKNTNSTHSDAAKISTSSTSFIPNSSIDKPRQQGKVTLMEKWFPGSTLKNATLDVAHAPPVEYIALTVSRINAARERLLSLRAGVEDVLDYTNTTTNNNDNDNNGDIIIDTLNWNWREVRDALSQLTSRNIVCTKKCVLKGVKWLLSTKPSMDVPKKPTIRFWEKYISQKGPEQGYSPPLSLLVWLDSACTTALFTALVNRMLKSYKQGMKPVVYSWYDAQEEEENNNNNNNEEEEPDEEEEEDNDNYSSFESHENNNTNNSKGKENVVNETVILASRLPPLSGSGASEDIISLLSFLRVLMPVDIEDDSKNIIGHSTGYGSWLYACFSALDTPLEPDVDRLVHELFRACCRQVRTIAETHGVRGDNRGAILQALPRRCDNKDLQKNCYNVISDVRREDILALHTIIIILAKLFRQNQNRLIPL